MAVSSTRSVIIHMTGDVAFSEEFSAAENNVAPGSVTLHSLSTGNNQINLPSSSGVTVAAATIIPPSTNTQALLIKGTTAGDAGLPISKTQPTSIAFDSTPPTHFHINSAGTVDGLRIVWN